MRLHSGDALPRVSVARFVEGTRRVRHWRSESLIDPGQFAAPDFELKACCRRPILVTGEIIVSDNQVYTLAVITLGTAATALAIWIIFSI